MNNQSATPGPGEEFATLSDLLRALGRSGDVNPTAHLEDWLETRLYHDVDLSAYESFGGDNCERVDLFSDACQLPSIDFPVTRVALDSWLAAADELIANARLISHLKDWDYDDDEDGPSADLIVNVVAELVGIEHTRLHEDLGEDDWEVLDEHGVVGYSTAPDVLVAWRQRVVLGLSPEYLSVHSTHWEGPDLVIDDGYSDAFVGEWDLTEPDRELTYSTLAEAMHETLRNAPPRPLPKRKQSSRGE